MNEILTHFHITSLQDTRDVHVRIDENKLVLVGENGTGKSTVVNLVYFFLTGQWKRMLDYKFSQIEATISSKSYKLDREELAENFDRLSPGIRNSNRLYRRLPSFIIRELDTYVFRQKEQGRGIDKDYALYLADKFDVSPSIIMEYLFEHVDLTSVDSPFANKLSEIRGAIAKSGIGQILYLPTYRRIEQDLHQIVPGIERQTRRFRDRFLDDDPVFIELVEFGMEDVEKTINNTMTKIKDNVRNGLNALTGTYLRDVIRGEYRSDDLLPKLQALEDQTINSIFNRIPKTVLNVSEQDRLREIIVQIKSSEKIADEDKVVAHFLTQLLELHNQQTESEKSIQDFVSVCNEYLIGKRIEYNNQDFEIAIYQSGTDGRPHNIEMRMLSSGEKQIVSLFSHVYLSGGSGYFVIIDEPELSLSVPWQKRFLPDILNSGRCGGLIAVTHSPFIYDNELDSFAHSLEEFVVKA